MRLVTPPVDNCGLEQFGLSQSDLTQLVLGLAQADVGSRRLVRGALRDLGAVAVPELARALQSGDVCLRQGAVEMLRQIDGAEQAIEALAEALRDDDWLVRVWAADALGRLREAAVAAVPALESAMRDSSVQVRTAAYVALRWINGMGSGS
jgi:HEAT repeat protein